MEILNSSQCYQQIIKSQDFKLDVINNMLTYGGSFVQALAKCFSTADSNNLRKLANAFINYVVEYQPAKWVK